MNRIVSGMLGRAAALVFMLMAIAAGAAAQETMKVYVARDALDEYVAQQMMDALERRYPEMQWDLIEDAQDLRALVLADCAPQLAICSPGEAQAWAEEGLLLPLQTVIGGQSRIERQVIDACVWNEQLFVAPLQAKHRRIAVNVKLFAQKRLGYMLDEDEYTAWYPTQFQQIVEEFALADMTALDIWLPEENGAALEAMVQAVYGGSFVSEEGDAFALDTPEIRAGVQWLRDLLAGGMIGMAQSREAALERFVRGETAMFIDWTEDDAKRHADTLEEGGVEVTAAPYPSTLGVPVRSVEIAGVCAFDSGNAQRNTLAMQAAALLYEHAQALPGGRAMYRDDGIWLACLSGTQRGATLRSLFAQALEAVLDGDKTPKEALSLAQAALDAAQ